jgi:hypothetical protein
VSARDCAQVGEAHADRDRAPRQRFDAEPRADAVGEMMQRRLEDAWDGRLPPECRLRAGRMCPSPRLDLSRVAVPRQRRQFFSSGVPEQPLERRRRARRQLTDRRDADRCEPRFGGRTDAPHQSHGQVVEEFALALRIDDDQSVRLDDLRGDLGQVLGARYAD